MEGCHYSHSLLWSKDVHADIRGCHCWGTLLLGVLSSCPISGHRTISLLPVCTDPSSLSDCSERSLMSLGHRSCARREPWQLVAIAAIGRNPKTLGVCEDILQQLPLLLHRARML